MFKITIVLALIAVAAAIPIRVEEDPLDKNEVPEVIAILKSESNQNADGSYNFMYESSDGSYRQENAEIVSLGDDEETMGIKITGMYKYIDANGDEIVVTYTADENGFVPVGTNINKEISDAAIAARDLPKDTEIQARSRKDSPKGRSLEVAEEPKLIPVQVITIVEEPVQKIAEPIVKKIAEPIVEKIAEPVVEKIAEPVVENIAEPVAEKIAQPVAEKIALPILKKIAEPIAEKIVDVVVKAVTDPEAKVE